MNNFFETTIVFERVQDAVAEGVQICVAVALSNQTSHLLNCLNSINAQQYQSLELVLVEDRLALDGSVSLARDWLESNAARFSRVLFLQHKHGQGLAQTRNTAFTHARAECIFVMDAGNEIYPRCIARLADAIHESGCQVAYSQSEFFSHSELFDDAIRLGKADVWQPEMFAEENFVGSMGLVSKSAWQAVGGYDQVVGNAIDHDFWCKFVENGFSGAFVPEILCRYRLGETELSSSMNNVEMILRHPWLKI